MTESAELYSDKDRGALLEAYGKMRKLRNEGHKAFLLIEIDDDGQWGVMFAASQVMFSSDTLEEAVALSYGGAVQKFWSDKEKAKA